MSTLLALKVVHSFTHTKSMTKIGEEMGGTERNGVYFLLDCSVCPFYGRSHSIPLLRCWSTARFCEQQAPMHLLLMSKDLDNSGVDRPLSQKA
jgi:hypothetical protein